MIQFWEKAGRTDRRTDDTKFIRPHYRGSKNKKNHEFAEKEVFCKRNIQLQINKQLFMIRENKSTRKFWMLAIRENMSTRNQKKFHPPVHAKIKLVKVFGTLCPNKVQCIGNNHIFTGRVT